MNGIGPISTLPARRELFVAALNASAQELATADYFCDGTGDEVEINAAITSLPTAGGVVRLSSGTFTIGASIVLRTNLGLVGPIGGRTATIMLANGSNTSMIVYNQTVNGSAFIYVGYLYLNGNIANNSSGHGIYMYPSGSGTSVYDVEIDRVYVNSAKQHGIWIDHAWGLHLHDCNSESNGGSAYNFTSPSQSYIRDCYGSSSAVGLLIDSGSSNFVSNVELSNNTTQGLQITSASKVRFANMIIITPSGSKGVYGSGLDCTFTGLSVDSSPGSTSMLDLAGAGRLQFIGGSMTGTATNGFNIRSGSDSIRIMGFNFAATITNPVVVAASTHINVSRCFGYVTENSGTATVASGATTVAVPHGLATTPTRVQVTATLWGNSAKAWVTSIGATTFTINVDADPGAGTATFDWKAVLGEGN